MKPIGRSILLILFLMVGIYVLVSSALKPYRNWDMIMYIAVAKSYEESDLASLHRFTYDALQHSVSDSEYESLIQGTYRQAIYSDLSAFKEQFPFYQIRPLYTGLIYLLYKAGVDIVFATHIIPAFAVFAGLILLYLMSVSILGHPFAYAVPFLALIFGVVDIGRCSTPDGMAFLAVMLSAYLFVKDRIPLLIFSLPMMIGIRTDLVLYIIPLLLVVALSRKKYRKLTVLSAFLSVLFYFAIGILSNNPGWSTTFYFSFVEHLAHPLSEPPVLRVKHYLRAVSGGLWWAPADSRFVLYCLMFLYYLGLLASHVKATSLIHTLRSPMTLLSMVSLFFVLVHFVLFPLTWSRFFVGPYLIGAFSLLAVMTDGLKLKTTAQSGAASDGI